MRRVVKKLFFCGTDIPIQRTALMGGTSARPLQRRCVCLYSSWTAAPLANLHRRCSSGGSSTHSRLRMATLQENEKQCSDMDGVSSSSTWTVLIDAIVALAAEPPLSSSPLDQGSMQRRLYPVERCWREIYDSFFEVGKEPLPTRNPELYSGFSPSDADEVPLFLQAVGQLGLLLHNALTDLRCDPKVDLRDVLWLQQWLAEVQAVLICVGNCQLHHCIPPTLRQRFPSTIAAPVTSMPPEPGATQEGLVALKKDVVTAPCTVSSSRHYRLPLFQRHADQTFSTIAPPLPQDDLMRVVVLLDAVRTILDVAAPSSPSVIQASLYRILLAVLGVGEQLSSTALATLATCLAQCRDSYAALQRTSTQEVAVAEMEATPPHCPVEYLRRFHLSDTRREIICCPSAQEQRETDRFAMSQGGLLSTVQPISVLHHLHVLSNLAQHRMRAALGKAAPPYHEGASLGGKECCSSVQAVHQQSQLKRGMMGLMSLEERKRREPSPRPLTQPEIERQRRRRTVGDLQRGSDTLHRPLEEEEHTTAGLHAEEHRTTPLIRSEADVISLADVAELSTALAAMGYASDMSFWTTIQEFVCAEIRLTAKELAAVPSGQVLKSCASDTFHKKTPATAAGQGEEEEEERSVVRSLLLRGTRDVAFALDHVNHLRAYQAVMSTLVEVQLLPAAIPPPSEMRRGMQECTPCVVPQY